MNPIAQFFRLCPSAILLAWAAIRGAEPASPSAETFIGAPEPAPAAKASPLTPEEEQATFTLAPGFEIELVAAESEGIGKFVAIDWDLQGRLWSMTALEYPVDANESPAAAGELYASKAKDKVLAFDHFPVAAGVSRRENPASAPASAAFPLKPRVFADGLAIPLGILPYKNGVYVQHGPDIVFLSDTDGDGRADKREVILTGFGVQDSHLFPHQFTRAPGNWIWMAQGAFNYGKVRTTRGAEVQFDQTRMAKFRYDGSDFDITSQGPCNIWGLVLDGEGQAWIQEANDYGYPVMPFHEYANYPGCSDGQWKSYAPEFPGTAPDFRMGGTGLSGLALSDGAESDEFRMTNDEKLGAPATGNSSFVIRHSSLHTFPSPYARVFYIANPIVRKIQAIKVTRDGPRFRYQKLADFVQSSDEWFRPVALRLGPDGCLYIVDWYNKIISHNEVPRNHPERDKKRGRIWRVKHKDQKPFPVPDFAKLSGDDLLARLGGPSLQQSHLAWQAIADRQMHELAPKLIALVADTSQAAARRIASLWALEGLRRLDAITLMPLLTDANRNLRREAVRAFGEANLPLLTVVAALEPLANDSDPEVRAEVIRTTGKAGQASRLSGQSEPAVLLRATALLTRLARAPLAEPTAKSTHSSKIIKIGEAYDRAFERYLVRMFLERQPEVTAAFLDSDAAQALPPENGLLAALALEPRSSAQQVAKLLPGLTRPAGDEELLRLAQFPDEPGVGDALKAILQRPETRTAALESLLKVRTRLDPAKLAPLLTEVARTLWAGEDDSATMALRLATAFRLAALEEEINDALCCGGTRILKANQHLLAMKAMRALGANLLEGVVAYVNSPDPSLADEAVATLASSRNELAPKFVLWKFWFSLTAPQRRVALDLLAGTRHGAHATVRAIKSGTVDRDELDAATLDKLHAVLGADPELAALMEEMAPLFRPALRLNGEDDAWSDTDITLAGPFTVETWVQLDPGIDNSDGILGAPGVLDLNFFEAKFRVWVGGGAHDVIIATKTAVPDVWIHYAVTRDPAGQFRIYINGELDRADSKTAPQNFEHCRIGWTAPGKGTAGWLTEFRVWNCARTPDEIRAHFDRSFEDAGRDALPRVSDLMHGSRGNATLPPGLVFYAPGSGPWGKLRNGAKIQKTPDFPALLTTAEANALSEKFAKFRALAAQPGDIDRGRALFTTICQQCHSVGGQGGQVGPVLNGAGALGLETLLRNILTPNAAMEPGYRIFRVELEDGDVLDGILVSQDTEALILRRPNVDDVRIPRRATRKAGFAKSSMMPEGLLEALQPEEVTDLLAYLMTLK